MENTEQKSRADKAVDLFVEGYNCSQAVFMAFADKFDIDKTTAAALSTSFGGGIGRLREMCGAVSGGAMLLGLKYPHLHPSDTSFKDKNYQIVQNFALEFKKKIGSYNCDEILDIFSVQNISNPITETEKLYAEKPCARCVRVAAELIEKELSDG